MHISFCGLKENVLYGCKAVGDVKKDFPNGLLMSNTYYDLFEKEKNLEVQESLEAAIDRTRFIVDQYIRQGFSSKDAVEKAVKKTGVANCGEQAVLVSRKLDEIGISNRVIQMDICRNSKDRFVTGGHTFCLIGASQDMDIKEPKTWGEEAVVVDMWLGIVKKVSEALNYFSGFVVPKKDEHIEFIVKTYY